MDEKMKYEKIIDKIKLAFERLAYRQEEGEKIGEKHYDYNVSNLEEMIDDLMECVRDETWGAKEKENWK